MAFDLRHALPILRAVGVAPDMPISAVTRFCAVLGHPIRHSASPPMHNAAIAALHLPWCYLAFDVPPDALRAALEGARAMRFIGLNLTVPHKLLAVPLVDLLDDTARTWGAVNTVRFEARDSDGHWRPLAAFEGAVPEPVRAVGFNTDADAILQALREDLAFEPRGRRIVLLGAGGAGRVAALRLAAEDPAALYLVNRTADKARLLAEEIRARHPGVDAVPDYPDRGPVDLILNATSLGLRPDDPLPLDEARLPLDQARRVYDMVYRPAVTPLLHRAGAAGCRTANGLGMLLHQGARAFEIWSGQPAPLATMRQALGAAIHP